MTNQLKRRDILTTGQVARYCRVAPRTVSKWFDSGKLKGYRIPGSHDRRIPTNALLKFMRDHNMPTADLVGDLVARVLLVTQDDVFASELRATLKDRQTYEVVVAGDAFAAGLAVGERAPQAVVIDYSIGDLEAERIASSFGSDLRCLVSVIPGGPDQPANGDSRTHTFPKPVPVGRIAALIDLRV